MVVKSDDSDDESESDFGENDNNDHMIIDDHMLPKNNVFSDNDPSPANSERVSGSYVGEFIYQSR